MPTRVRQVQIDGNNVVATIPIAPKAPRSEDFIGRLLTRTSRRHGCGRDSGGVNAKLGRCPSIRQSINKKKVVVETSLHRRAPSDVPAPTKFQLMLIQ